MSEQPNEIQLSFSPSPRIQEGLEKVGLRQDLTELIVKMKDLKKWFEGYKVESIELYIEGMIRDGNITRLFVSFEGRGGCKIILKPNEATI